MSKALNGIIRSKAMNVPIWMIIVFGVVGLILIGLLILAGCVLADIAYGIRDWIMGIRSSR